MGVFLAYVTAKGYAPLDRQLYLPKEWAEDAQRRQEKHVPEAVQFQEGWRIGLDLLDCSGAGRAVRHGIEEVLQAGKGEVGLGQ